MAAQRSIRGIPTDPMASETVSATLVTAISQTGVVAWSLTPGFAFQITRIRTYCLLKAGVCTGNVKIGTRTAAPLVFTSATELAAVLSTTLANLRGSATEAITVEYTTDGSGVLTNGGVFISYRPYPMRGEATVGP
jgi:hypothetical protein